MNNIDEGFAQEMPGELDQVDWTEVSAQQTSILRDILRVELGGFGSPLGDQIAETAEINEFVYDPASELPPPIEGPLGRVEVVLREDLFFLLQSYGVSEEVARNVAPGSIDSPMRAKADQTNCTTSTRQQGACTIVTTRCRYCP